MVCGQRVSECLKGKNIPERAHPNLELKSMRGQSSTPPIPPHHIPSDTVPNQATHPHPTRAQSSDPTSRDLRAAVEAVSELVSTERRTRVRTIRVNVIGQICKAVSRRRALLESSRDVEAEQARAKKKGRTFVGLCRISRKRRPSGARMRWGAEERLAQGTMYLNG